MFSRLADKFSCCRENEISKKVAELQQSIEQLNADMSEHFKKMRQEMTEEMKKNVAEEFEVNREKMTQEMKDSVDGQTSEGMKQQLNVFAEEMHTKRKVYVEEQMELIRAETAEESLTQVKEHLELMKEELSKVAMAHVKEQLRLMREELSECVKAQVKEQEERSPKPIEMKLTSQEATERYDLLTGKRKIFVCGGHDDLVFLSSVLSFNWQMNSWEQEANMLERRGIAASAFVHGSEIFVSGGGNEHQRLGNVESLNMNEPLEWKIADFKMPLECYGHSMVHYNDTVIMTGGYCTINPVLLSDKIYRIQMNPPHTTDVLARMPEARSFHGALIIGDQILIIGGRTANEAKDIKDTVYSYSLHSWEYKALKPLPYPVSDMATVGFRDKAILIGGVNDQLQRLSKVLSYDVKTGETKTLPSLNHKRSACAAVIAGNIIVVVGGHGGESYLDSVECLDLSKNDTWRELSPMTSKRNLPSAVLSPVQHLNKPN